jgi:hypothetical protein
MVRIVFTIFRKLDRTHCRTIHLFALAFATCLLICLQLTPMIEAGSHEGTIEHPIPLSVTQLTHSHLISLLAFPGSNDCREDGNCPPATEGLALCLQPKEQAMRSTAGRCTSCMRCNATTGEGPCHGTRVPVAVGDEPTPRPVYCRCCHAKNGPKRPVCRSDRPIASDLCFHLTSTVLVKRGNAVDDINMHGGFV